MAKVTYSGLKQNVNQLAQKINVPADLLPDYERTRDFAYPHIEIDGRGFLSFVVVERGQELERRTTESPDELLFWIFSSITFSMACKFELKNRLYAQDCRRMIFDKQEALLGELSASWRQREWEEHQQVLMKHPFDDNVNLRVDYYVELISKGHSVESATKLSDEKFRSNK